MLCLWVYTNNCHMMLMKAVAKTIFSQKLCELWIKCQNLILCRSLDMEYKRPYVPLLATLQMKWTHRVNFTNPLVQSANALVIILQCRQSLFLFHQQNNAQLYNYKLLENTLNFYTVCQLVQHKPTGSFCTGRMLIKLSPGDFICVDGH